MVNIYKLKEVIVDWPTLKERNAHVNQLEDDEDAVGNQHEEEVSEPALFLAPFVHCLRLKFIFIVRVFLFQFLFPDSFYQ